MHILASSEFRNNFHGMPEDRRISAKADEGFELVKRGSVPTNHRHHVFNDVVKPDDLEYLGEIAKFGDLHVLNSQATIEVEDG